MSGKPLQNMKNGANKFIDIIAENSGGTQNGEIGAGSHIGIVSFSDTATSNVPLSTSVSTLKSAVNSLTSGGFTNHADAFTKAIELFDQNSTNEKIIIMFTDGKTTVGGNAAPIAKSARDSGIAIYCIGLAGSDGIDLLTLNDWASKPSDTYVSITPDDDKLEELFEEVAHSISKPGATNIVIDEIIHSDFKILTIKPPTKGSYTWDSSTSLQWKIEKLGIKPKEEAVLEFTVQHISSTPGKKAMNHSIHYKDDQHHTVTFPSPEVTVSCGIITHPEPCPDPKKITIGSCQDSVIYEVGDVYLSSLGRILQLNINLKNVCPNKRIALAVILDEVDRYGKEHQRGIKIMTVPAHHSSTCRDVLVKCIKFVLPEDLDVADSSPFSLCNPRNFKVRVIAHPIDSDFKCCDIIL